MGKALGISRIVSGHVHVYVSSFLHVFALAVGMDAFRSFPNRLSVCLVICISIFSSWDGGFRYVQNGFIVCVCSAFLLLSL